MKRDKRDTEDCSGNCADCPRICVGEFLGFYSGFKTLQAKVGKAEAGPLPTQRTSRS